jgi:eukaryotic-like serine/threonine-protein kinase
VATLTAGAILDRRFRLTVPLGPPAVASGTGPVWRATELGTGAHVAVKLLAAHLAGDMVAEARFRLAIRTIAQVISPEVTRILDYGEIAQPGGFAVPYVVRELADGRSLAGLLGAAPLPVEEALRVVATAADALAVAHRAGLVHGRIQPGNVIVGPDRVRITDFGLGGFSPGPAGWDAGSVARREAGSGYGAGAGSGRGWTADGLLSYQAPELAAGGAPAPPADVYAVGVMFAACLAGADASARAAARAIPASLSGLWAACLATSPRDRPGAAHVAVLVRQALAELVGPALTASGPWPVMAASSRPARRPASPAARWPG